MTGRRNRRAKVWRLRVKRNSWITTLLARKEIHHRGAEKRRKALKQRTRRLDTETTEKSSCDAKTSARWSSACCAPTDEANRLVSGRIGTGARRRMMWVDPR